MNENQLPEDTYSRTWARLSDNPAAATPKGATVNLTTLLGHSETWVVHTVRIGQDETAFLQRVNAEGGMRLVLPPEVCAAIARQRDIASTIVRRRGAHQAVATRREKASRK